MNRGGAWGRGLRKLVARWTAYRRQFPRMSNRLRARGTREEFRRLSGRLLHRMKRRERGWRSE